MIAVTVGILGSGTFVAGVVGVQAASAAPARLRCQTMQSTDLVAQIQLGGCNHPGTSGGSATSTGQGSGPYPVPYMTGKQTNFAEGTGFFASPDRCPSDLLEFDITGTIVSVSGHFTKRYLGELVSFDICLTSDFAIAQLVPGTSFRIT